MDRTFRRSLDWISRPALFGGILAVGMLGVHANAHAAMMSPAPFPVAQDEDPVQLVKDFMHYVLIARPDLAEATGNALFAQGDGMTEAAFNERLASIVSENDLGEKAERVFQRGRRMDGVGDMVIRFENALENGRLELARNPERVEQAIDMLTGTMRKQMLAKKRLLAAGEYAVPALLQVLVEGKNPQLEIEATRMLEEIKRQAVLPLSEALSHLHSSVQPKVCRILAKIGWPTAIPYLLQVAQDSSSPDNVKDAAMRAFRQLGGTSTDVSTAFSALARKFFDQEQSLIAYPGDPANMVWGYGDYTGLSATAVPTNIFAQVMAKIEAERALKADPRNQTALTLYVASDLRRENLLKAGQVDPLDDGGSYTPQFFATASGAGTVKSVLSMAIDARDTALVRDAIAALGETAGRGAMFSSGEREPLLECLQYPDRRVQYDAALVLGGSLPSKGFTGDNQVVTLVASAIRAGENSFAVVIADGNNDFDGMLRTDGFTMLGGGASFYDIEPEVNKAGGVDLIVVDATPEKARQVVSQIRDNPRTGATPVIVAVDPAKKDMVAREFDSDRATSVWITGADAASFKAVTDNLLMKAAGGRLSQADAMGYTIDALDTLYSISVDQGSVYDILDAEPALLDAMASVSGRMKLMVARVMAMVPSQDSQRALIDGAMAATGSDQVTLLDEAARSARRFGSFADDRQVSALRKLIEDSSGSGNNQLADAAGRLYGSLGLPSSETIQLIISE